MKKDSPKITVYVPCHNYGEFLGEAIESVLCQTYKNWEMIIIDDGSTDNTPDVIDLYKNAPNIRCFRTEKIGLPKVCNFAISEAQGEYIIRLDGDDVFDENILLVLTAQLDNDENLALVFPDFYFMDMQGNVFARERLHKLYHEDHLLEMPPNGACTLSRTTLLRDLGGYREDLGAQDGFDLWARIRESHKCGNVNLPLFYYRRHDSNLTGSNGHSPIIQNARREIKKDASKVTLESKKPVTVILPARSHYDFAPDLWSLELGGRTLLSHNLSTCIESDIFDRIIVTCDNPGAEKELEKFDDPRLEFKLRTHETTYRSASLSSLLEKIITPYDPELNGITLIRYIQTPFLSREAMEEAVYTIGMMDADTAIAIERYSDQNLYSRGPFGLQSLKVRHTQYVEGGIIYRDTNSCLAVRNSNLPKGNIMGPRIASFEVSGPEGFFVDNEHKYRVAKLIAEHF